MQTVNSREASDAIEIRSALEGFAAHLAAQRGIASAQTALLRQYVASMEKIAVAYGSLSTDMLAQYAKLNAGFHAMLFELAQSAVLILAEGVSPKSHTGLETACAAILGWPSLIQHRN